MAAIIGQMAAASRERKKRQLETGRKGGWPSNTANILLGEFQGPTFDPTRHNKYTRWKIEREKRLKYLGIVTEKRLAEDEEFHKMLDEQVLRRAVENSPALAANLGSTLSMTDKIEIMAVEQEKIDRLNRIVVSAVTGFAGFVSVGVFTVVLVYLFVMTKG